MRGYEIGEATVRRDGLEHVPHPLIVLDADLAVTAANARAVRLCLRGDGDPVGPPFLTGPLAEAWTPPVAPLIGMAAGTGATARGVHTNRVTGARELITVTPEHDASGRVMGMSVMAQPADAAAEEADRLGVRVRFLEGVFDHLPVPALVVDAETGVVLAASRALADIVGARPGELVGERTPLAFLDGWTHTAGPGRFPAAIRSRRGALVRARADVADSRDARGRTVRVLTVAPETGWTDPSEAPAPAEARAAVARLTPRRRQVLELLCEGLDTETIAVRLVISGHTARNHVQAVLRHLDCRSRLQAVAIAHRAGLGGR
ncbi:MAG: PAS domain-containing protein [Thermoleophilia bacterium]|nr:PAS domain-containing protein [Thermoleophilia bacterium]